MIRRTLPLALAVAVVLAWASPADAMVVAGDANPFYVQWAAEAKMPTPPRIVVADRECPEFRATICAHPTRRLVVMPDESDLFDEGDESSGEEVRAADAARRQQYVAEWELRQDEIRQASEEQGSSPPPREPVPPAAPVSAEPVEAPEDRSGDQAMYRFFFYHEVAHVIDLGEHQGARLYRRIFGHLIEGSTRIEPRELLADAYALCAFDRTKVTTFASRPLSAYSYGAWQPSLRVHRRVCRVLAAGLA